MNFFFFNKIGIENLSSRFAVFSKFLDYPKYWIWTRKLKLILPYANFKW
jgi:hypothetical protein